jgi:biotin transport system permease protein
MLAISVEGDSWAHRLCVGKKMAALAIVSIALFWIDNLFVLAGVLGVVVVLYASISRTAMRMGLRLMRPLFWVVGLIWIFHAIRAEYLAGTVICLRLMVLVAMANFVTLTSRLTEMTDMFLWLLSPLQRVGISTAPFALALSMVMRFTPVLIERASRLSESWRARGGKRANWRILLPLFITVVDDADRVAEALKARGGVR